MSGLDRVLVVDDESQIVRALRTGLEPRIRGLRGGDGETALDILDETAMDILVLDLGLPGIDGIEVIRRLRGWSEVPIVVLSVGMGDGTRSLPWMRGPTTTS